MKSDVQSIHLSRQNLHTCTVLVGSILWAYNNLTLLRLHKGQSPRPLDGSLFNIFPRFLFAIVIPPKCRIVRSL